MILIFGTRAYFRTHKSTQHGFCQHCDHFVKQKSFNARTFFHAYYVPLIPVSGRKRHLKVCARCNLHDEWELDDCEKKTEAVQETAADAVIALQSGETTLTSGAHGDHGPSDCVALLCEAVDWLFAVGKSEFCQGLTGQLRTPETAYAKHILTATMARMNRDLDTAVAEYQAAAGADATVVYPKQQAGHLLVVQNQPAEAVRAYQEAMARTDSPHGRVRLLMQLAPQQMAAKQYADAAKSYDQLFELNPPIAADRNFRKAADKAKKKAGLI